MNLFKLTFCESSELEGECHFSDTAISEPPTHLRIGIFFDGTRNDDQNEDTTTNIHKLYKLYPCTLGGKLLDKTPYCSIYARGVGTAGHLKDIEAGTGLGGQERMNGVLYEIDQYTKVFKSLYHREPKIIQLDVFGFSRGAATARHFVNAVLQRHLVQLFLDRFDPTFEVEFLGIFDTVAAIGIPGDESNPGYALEIPADKVRKTVHLVAEDELREKFDLVSAIPKPSFHVGRNYITDRIEEIMCPGVHADIGGGYKSGSEHGISNNKLALIYCNLMYDKAVRCGVPFITHPPHKVHEELFSCYNAIESIYEHFGIDRSLKFRSLCRFYRHLSMTLDIVPKNSAKLLANVAAREQNKINILSGIGLNTPTDPLLPFYLEEYVDNQLIFLDFTNHSIVNYDNYVDIEDEQKELIRLTESTLERIKHLVCQTGIQNDDFLDYTRTFYDNYVHNSLLAEDWGFPEIARQGFIENGLRKEVTIFKRKVFTAKAIDLNNSSFWSHASPYGFQRLIPNKSETVQTPKYMPTKILTHPVPQ